MNIRPCIDIHNGKVKQIVGASLRDASALRAEDDAPADAVICKVRKDPDTACSAITGRAGAVSAGTACENFVSGRDADYFASIYRDRNLSGGHIILLNSVREEAAYAADRQQAVKALAAYPGGMQIGGGVTPRTAGAFLDAGASHVIVTSYVFRDGRLDDRRLDEMHRAVGREHLVLDLSCRRTPEGRYLVVTDRWQRFTELEVCEETLESLSNCCGEFLIHAADVEGRRAGIEAPLVGLLGAWQHKRRSAGESPFPVTYAGGVHALSDITLLRTLASDTVDATVGSALDLFGGDLSLDELVRCAAGN